MLKNYLLTSFRNLKKFKIYSFINIAGLAAGITVCIIITLFLKHELSYDTFNEKADRIYRVSLEGPEGGVPRTPHPMAQALAADFPEVEQAVSMSPIWGPGLTWAEMSVRYMDNKFYEKRFFSADTTFFKVFSFRTIKGDADKAIHEPGAIIITESMAKKYFGSEDPINKILEIDGRFPIIVKAVIQDIPANSHFKFDFLISYVTLKPRETSNYYTWADFGHYNYVVLKKGADYKKVQAKIPEWSKKYVDYSIPDLKSDVDISKFLKLTPVTDLHLKSHLRWELEENGSMTGIYIFSAAAILILLIACINFMNISTARAIRRAKEVGVRKSIGAEKKHLVTQFLTESFLQSFIGIVIAAGLVEVFLPVINSNWGTELRVSQSDIFFYIAALFILFIVTGAAAGAYPAFILSSFKPAAVLSGKLRKGAAAAAVSSGLVIFQFAISVFLITSTLIIFSQMNFLREKDPGFSSSQLIRIPIKDNGLINNFQSLKSTLKKNMYVEAASGCTNVPGGQFNNESIRWNPDGESVGIAEVWVDEDYFSTLGISFSQGRGFSKEFTTDTTRAFILNESCAKRFKWDTPIGKEITWYPQDQAIKGTVIGVVKDFNYASMHENINPLLIHYGGSNYNNLLVKLKGGDITKAVAAVEGVVKQFSPGYEFEYYFMDECFASAYKNDRLMGSLFMFFSLFAVSIACLGLFGLAAFMVEQRTKEIGMRKVLGASVSNIVTILSSDFIKRVLIANLIAWPAAYYFMNTWLNQFAYHTAITWWAFIAAGLLTAVTAFATVSWQAGRAALANPVTTLKYE